MTVAPCRPERPCGQNGARGPPAAEERAAADERPAIAAGTELTFVVDETLFTDDTDAGHMLDAHLADAVTASDGTVALEAGTAARGNVVESRESDDPENPAACENGRAFRYPPFSPFQPPRPRSPPRRPGLSSTQ